MNAPAFGGETIAAARAATKAYLRVAGGAEDALIDAHVASALALAEAFTGCALVVRPWSAVLPAVAAWQRLPGAPVAAITAVEALSALGVVTPLPPGAYAVDVDAAGEGWVRVLAPGGAGRVRVAYSAGLAGSWEALPAPIAQGVVLLAAHLFEARASGGAPPAAVAALWRPWRRMRLQAARVPA